MDKKQQAKRWIEFLIDSGRFSIGSISHRLRVSIYTVDRWRLGKVAPHPGRMDDLERLVTREKQRAEAID